MRISNQIQHIFLADDDDDDSLLFKEALANISSGIKVSLAIDCQQLLSFLQIYKPDAIFLDLNMPGKNGLECLREIRSMNRFDHIPVIMYSTSEREKDIEACFQEGANFYLVKPYSFKAIIEMLQTLLHSTLNTKTTKPNWEAFVLKAN